MQVRGTGVFRVRSRWLQSSGRFVVAVLVLFGGLAGSGSARQRGDDPVKTIRGVVRDVRGEPVAEARVFIQNLDSKVTRTHSTDRDGLYRVNGLPADVDYEVRVQFGGAESETRLVSAFFNRSDNVLNFELPIAILPSGDAGDDEAGIGLATFDRVELRASFELPEGIPAPIPAALLLHGYGEDRSVWADLEARLLSEGWAVMALDLRGHGRSTMRNSEPITPSESWRTDPRQFPLDLEPALDWLKTQQRVDSGRIAVIGFDVGANLALVASGRFTEVGTSVAINPAIDEAQALAGAGQEFSPRTVQVIASSDEAAAEVRQHVGGASRTIVISGTGGTPVWLATGDTLDEIVRWLRDTY